METCLFKYDADQADNVNITFIVKYVFLSGKVHNFPSFLDIKSGQHCSYLILISDKITSNLEEFPFENRFIFVYFFCPFSIRSSDFFRYLLYFFLIIMNKSK